jgi:hypothetical protein
VFRDINQIAKSVTTAAAHTHSVPRTTNTIAKSAKSSLPDFTAFESASQGARKRLVSKRIGAS